MLPNIFQCIVQPITTKNSGSNVHSALHKKLSCKVFNCLMNIIISILRVKNLTLSFNNIRVDPGQLTGKAKFKPGLIYLKARVSHYIKQSNNFLT